MKSLTIRLPRIDLLHAGVLVLCLFAAIVGAYVLTPAKSEIAIDVDLENEVPRAFGDWKERASPFVQVSLATGGQPDLNQPYDQTLMRAYENSRGDTVYLALAWGREQRQEVKIHRPDLCYIAQGFEVISLKPTEFNLASINMRPEGKHMIASLGRTTEFVSYWIRIGSLFSESAVETRMHILSEGVKGKTLDGILVRASVRINGEREADEIWQQLDSFLADLVKSSPENIKALLIAESDV